LTPKQRAIAKECLDSAKQYANDVISGKITTCRYVKLAVKRNFYDLKTGGERGLYFDELAAAKALVMFRYFRHWQGALSGQPVVLEPWQNWIISTVFGWKKKETGTRRFTEVYEEVAKKNGKTLKLAGIAIIGLIKDNEPGAEVYVAARNKGQAYRMWNDAAKFVKKSPLLRRRIKITPSRHIMEDLVDDGIFGALSKDSEGLDGKNPSFSLLDELHAHQDSSIYDIMSGGALAARKQGLCWSITTAGFNRESICYQVRKRAVDVLEQRFEDDSFFGIIYTLDDWEKEWKDPKKWIKANPNMQYCAGIDKHGNEIIRGSVNADQLKKDIKKAVNSPSFMTNVLTKRLNIWVGAETLWLNYDRWEQCERDYSLADLKGAVAVYGALDFSSTQDITSLVLVGVFENGVYKCWSRNYLPADRISEAVAKRNVPYDQWERDGYLVTTPGNVVDYDFIVADLIGTGAAETGAEPDTVKKGILDNLPIVSIAFDDWGSTQPINMLMNAGVVMLKFPQGFKSMSPSMKELERRYIKRPPLLYHPGDPVLTWAMSNLVAVSDPAGNIKPAKNKSSEKIDPAVALIMAVGNAMSHDSENIQQESVYAGENPVGV